MSKSIMSYVFDSVMSSQKWDRNMDFAHFSAHNF